jgi:hypothetical protein
MAPHMSHVRRPSVRMALAKSCSEAADSQTSSANSVAALSQDVIGPRARATSAPCCSSVVVASYPPDGFDTRGTVPNPTCPPCVGSVRQVGTARVTRLITGSCAVTSVEVGSGESVLGGVTEVGTTVGGTITGVRVAGLGVGASTTTVVADGTGGALTVSVSCPSPPLEQAKRTAVATDTENKNRDLNGGQRSPVA